VCRAFSAAVPTGQFNSSSFTTKRAPSYCIDRQNSWSSIDGSLRLRGSKFEANTIFFFNYDVPLTFTVQGNWSDEKFRQYSNRMPYPPESAQRDETLEYLQQSIRAATDIPQYQRSGQFASAIKESPEYFNLRGLSDIERGCGKVKNGQIITVSDLFHVRRQPSSIGRWNAHVRNLSQFPWFRRPTGTCWR
jgi:hypothetical protein